MEKFGVAYGNIIHYDLAIMDERVTALTIADIIRRAGGPTSIAEQSGGQISHWAVYKWADKGIPNRHWGLVCSLAGVSVNDIFAACEALRASRREPVSPEAA